MIPQERNVRLDQSNSNSSVFYLAHNSGGTSERVCKVPAGKGLFIPVMEVETSDKEVPNAICGRSWTDAQRRIRTALIAYISR